jgi:hypothetical protein
VNEVRSERLDGSTSTTANIEDGVELTAGGCVVVYDGLIQARMVVAVDLGIGFALFVVVGAECLFRLEAAMASNYPLVSQATR